jgi:RecA-family ATPase
MTKAEGLLMTTNQQAGFKVFPAWLSPQGQKIPLISGWKEAATTDQNQIKLWCEQYRDRLAFFGVPCGTPNDILVLDIDIKSNGWETIKQLGLQIPDTLSQKTLNGGTHFIFKYDPTRNLGNKVGFLPGLDIRSEGGWIAWYNKDVDWRKPILPAPEWIYHYANLKKPDAPVSATQANMTVVPDIARAAFDAAIQSIINAPAGESNDTLNRESFRIGQMVACGAISREVAETELFRAAKLRGKPDYESKATIKSGLDGGNKNPLVAPFTGQPVSAIAMPPAPEPPTRWTPRYFTRQDLLNTSKLRKPQLFRDWSTEDITLTTADGGTGKTTLKLFEAVCLALGERFLGFDCVQRGKTLFITGEDTAEKLAAMLGAMLKQMGLFDGTPEAQLKVDTVLQSIVIKKDADLCLIVKDKQGFLYPNRDALEKVMQAVDDIKPKLIVFDPISSFWGSESGLNDMNKAVTRFMSELCERSKACVEMINHMGKSSSANKDITQFAGRGGSGLPSNSRVARVMRGISPEEYIEMTGTEIMGDKTAMVCVINKFSDGSPLLNKHFLIIRDGYLFSRLSLSLQKTRELEKELADTDRIFTFIKQEREKDKYPTAKVVIGHFMNCAGAMSQDRIKRALTALEYTGHMGEKITQMPNPDVLSKDRVLIVTDMDGRELR